MNAMPASTPVATGGRFQVLALSGGGFRGLYTAQVLADLETEIGGPIARHFDLISGTSVGGILALAVAMEIPARKIVELFVKHGEEIFKKVLAVASGGHTKSEDLGYGDLEFVPWQIGATM